MSTVKDKYNFTVTWHPFFLRPNLPPEGVPIGDVGLRQGMLANIARAGQEVGIEFTMKCDRIPNTLQAHALLEHYGDDSRLQNELVEALFKAYFTDGLYPGGATLLDIAESAGVAREQAEDVIQSESKLRAAREKAEKWAMAGVSAVPMFFINGQRTFSGAQDVQTFVRMFEIVAERFPLPAKPASSY